VGATQGSTTAASAQLLWLVSKLPSTFDFRHHEIAETTPSPITSMQAANSTVASVSLSRFLKLSRAFERRGMNMKTDKYWHETKLNLA
jgi:hypothetical protein